ncbi:hypothetical protein C7271_01375 [filamentous cyanobacterium CCP5]|nr:hypothetical protein C7271_01375 [filamentous cyanobacterium CCP5]
MITDPSVPSIAQGQRLLAAIMVTDAVGFSTRMSENEEQTLRLIDRDLRLIAKLCDQYEGTVLKSTGDGLLTYFVSAVQAVSCALEIQTQLVALSASQRNHIYLDHRIGIHLGDILVSSADVMGNGVNIAARLQTYAKPQGLCISQTLYDVVKARLNLYTTYLGPLRLKNIREPVIAFQVDLLPEGELISCDSAADSTCLVTATPEALLETAIRGLAFNPQNLRLKKLLFAITKNAWENDPTALEQFEFEQLLVDLRQRYPTLPELRIQLTCLVAGLNRKATYTALADTLIIQLEPWYQSCNAIDSDLQAEETGVLAGWEEAIIALEQVSSPLRMRKLLFCLVNNTWENDSRVLNAYLLERLVEEAFKITPTQKDLKYHLHRIIKRLNRRQEYTRVANEIIQALNPLFSGDEEPTQITIVQAQLRDSQPPNTRIELVTATGRDMTTLHTTLSAPVSMASAAVGDSNSQASPCDRQNLYNLRQEIMHYTNPLRAKILLHSCLYGPFGFERQDWSVLKKQTLEQLLREIFDYCPSFEDLDSKLTIISHCLDNAEENAQVAYAIAQAIRPYYPTPTSHTDVSVTQTVQSVSTVASSHP